MAAYKARLQEFDQLISEEKIEIQKVQKLCFSGVPDEGGRRALFWKILLNYLPLTPSQWNDTLNKKRAQYRHFVEEMVVEPARLSKKNEGSEDHVEDHPLNPNPDSQWGSFFKDNEVLTQIDKDVRRLCPDIMFFQRGTDFPCRLIVDDPDVERLHRRVTYSSLKASTVTRKGLGVTKGEEHNGWNVLYQNMKQGQTASKELAEFFKERVLSSGIWI